MTSTILVGIVGAPHGIRGELRVKSFTENPLAIATYRRLRSEDGRRAFKVAAVRALKDDMVVARFEGIASRDAAAALTGLRLTVDRAALPAAAADEFYHADLIGLAAVSADGTTLGRVAAMVNYGAGDILEIAAENGESLLVAFTEAFVPVIDVPGGRLTVSPAALVAANDDGEPQDGAPPLMWSATVFTLFPDWFPGPLGASLAGDALARGLWSLEAVDLRAYGLGRHRAVDDTPAGGGPGMVMRADVIAAALDAALPAQDGRPRLYMSPRGRPLTQPLARQFAAGAGLVLLCGRFEGVDERVLAARSLQEVSVGDYVLSGGEIPAFAVLDAAVRLLPGVMGTARSGEEESFEGGLLEYPHYTRPRLFEGRAIPEVLLSGDHARIAAWRRAEAEAITAARRPDLRRAPETSSERR